MKIRHLLFLAAACGMQAQTTKPAQEASPAVLHSTTRMVYMTVVARNGKGAPVRGLNAAQMHVLQDGAEQKIVVFEEVTQDSAKADARKFAHSTDAEGFTYNIGDIERNPQRMVIVLIDNLNAAYMNQLRSKQKIVDFLQKGLPADQPTSLMILGREGLKQLSPFTTDGATLAKLLQRAQASLGRRDFSGAKATQLGPPQAFGGAALPSPSQADSNGDFSADALETMQSWLSQSNNRYVKQQALSTTRDTIAAMMQIAGAYEGVPGRKTLIWLTDGLPFQLQDTGIDPTPGYDDSVRDLYREMWRHMEMANIAVYPISVEGVDVQMTSVGEAMGASRRYSTPAVYREANERHATLERFAQATGGRAYYNSNDITLGLATAARESSAYYLVGYYLSPNTKPGWRSLKVKIDSPGVSGNTREGFYYGQSEDPKQLEQSTQAALESSVDYTGLRFAARSLQPSAEASGALFKLPVQLRIPIDSVKVDYSDGSHVDLIFSLAAFTPSGKCAGRMAGSLNRRNTEKHSLDPDSPGFQIDASLELPPGEYSLRVLVRDNQGGRFGALHLPVRIPGATSTTK